VKLRSTLLLVFAVLLLPGSAQASMVFNGSFDTGNLSQWSLQQFCNPSRATVYTSTSQPGWPAPASGPDALRLEVFNSDVSPCTPTGNPRAQIASSPLLAAGNEYWERFQVYFPSTWPTTSSWQLFQEDYGSPWNGSPPINFGVHGTNIDISRGANHNYDRVWAMPLTRGHWYTFLVHKLMSASDATGFIELWVDGAPQKFSNGATRLYTNTLAADHTGAYQFYLNSYRALNTANMSDIFFDGGAIGTTQADVATTTITPSPPAGGGGSTVPPPPAAPTAAFTWSPTHPIHAQTTVQFDGSASQGAVKYSWSLDGITYLTGVRPTFMFQHVGTKHVTLTVTDANGHKASVEHDIYVS
jgi:hypothetical protein